MCICYVAAKESWVKRFCNRPPPSLQPTQQSAACQCVHRISVCSCAALCVQCAVLPDMLLHSPSPLPWQSSPTRCCNHPVEEVRNRGSQVWNNWHIEGRKMESRLFIQRRLACIAITITYRWHCCHNCLTSHLGRWSLELYLSPAASLPPRSGLHQELRWFQFLSLSQSLTLITATCWGSLHSWPPSVSPCLLLLAVGPSPELQFSPRGVKIIIRYFPINWLSWCSLCHAKIFQDLHCHHLPLHNHNKEWPLHQLNRILRSFQGPPPSLEWFHFISGIFL